MFEFILSAPTSTAISEVAKQNSLITCLVIFAVIFFIFFLSVFLLLKQRKSLSNSEAEEQKRQTK